MDVPGRDPFDADRSKSRRNRHNPQRSARTVLRAQFGFAEHPFRQNGPGICSVKKVWWLTESMKTGFSDFSENPVFVIESGGT